MSNCAWCNKYGAAKFVSFENRKKQYSREKFCSKKCLSEYEQNNNTVEWYDAKYEDESNLKRIEESNNYRKVQEIKGKKLLYLYAAIFFFGLGIAGLKSGIHFLGIIFLLIAIFYSYKRIYLIDEDVAKMPAQRAAGVMHNPLQKVIADYNKFIIRGRKIVLKFVIIAAIVVSTLWGILTLFQTKWNRSDAPKKYAISIMFISIGIFYFYKKIKAKKT
jgi:hypothetical protein